VTGRDDHLAAALWVRLAKCYGLVLREVRSRIPAGLTVPQLDVLAQLLRNPQGMTAGALSRALLVTAGNVTGIINRLEKRGLVSRAPHPRDRRTAVLRLTPAGRRVARREVRRHERLLATIFSRLPERDQSELRASLERLRGALEPRPKESRWSRVPGRSLPTTTRRRASARSPSTAPSA